MLETIANDAIPLETAILLCKEIRDEADRNWHTASARWCWECRQSSSGDPDMRGFLREPGNRGCILINQRYAVLKQ